MSDLKSSPHSGYRIFSGSLWPVSSNPYRADNHGTESGQFEPASTGHCEEGWSACQSQWEHDIIIQCSCVPFWFNYWHLILQESFDRTWALRRISREIGNLRLSADKAPSGLIDKILLVCSKLMSHDRYFSLISWLFKPSTQVNNNTICVICRRLMSTPST